MEPLGLVKILSLYGEMNTRPCAYSVRYRRHIYNPYISKEENEKQKKMIDSRYNVVLYGFKVNTDIYANMSHMFLTMIQMKKIIRHAWIDSSRQAQFVLISENNRQVPPNLFSTLLWSEKLCFSHSGHQRWPPNTTNSEGCFAPGRVWSPPETQQQEEENNLNHAWIDAVEHDDNIMDKSLEELAWGQKYQKYIEKSRIDEIEETRRKNTEQSLLLCPGLLAEDNETRRLQDKLECFPEKALLSEENLLTPEQACLWRSLEAEEDALQAAQHAYLVNWARRKEQNFHVHI